jgi:hypothetical protein
MAILPVLSCFSQDSNPPLLAIDPSTGKYTTGGIVQVENQSQHLLLEGAYKWLTEVKYANSLGSKGIIMDEAVFNKIIVSQYLITSPNSYNSKVRFLLTLTFKDSRFKYYFTDFSYIAVTSRRSFEETKTDEEKILVQKFIAETNGYIRDLIAGLTAYLTTYKPDESW